MADDLTRDMAGLDPEGPRVIQFSGPAPVSLFPPPETGEGKGGGEDRWSAQTVLLPPIPTFPRQGGRGRMPRKARRKSRTEWPCAQCRTLAFVLQLRLTCQTHEPR